MPENVIERQIMPGYLKDLSVFLDEIVWLLNITARCRAVLFRQEFQQSLTPAVDEVTSHLKGFAKRHEIRNPEEYQEMRVAGLYGTHLNLKLESFEAAVLQFRAKGGQDNLDKALDIGKVILGSLAGAIPGFGSLAQELVDFVLQEMRKRLRWRPW